MLDVPESLLDERRRLVASVETGRFAADDDYRVPDLSVTRPAQRIHRGVDDTAELVLELRSPHDGTDDKRLRIETDDAVTD